MHFPRKNILILFFCLLGWGAVTARAQVASVDLPENGPSQETPVEIASETAGKELEAAMKDFRAGRLKETLQKLQTLRQSDSQLSPPPLIVAQWFSLSQQPDAARNWVVRAIREFPEDPEPYLVLADVNLNRRRWPEAELLYEKAQELLKQFEGDPQRKQSMVERYYGGMASVEEAYGETERARELLQELLKNKPENTLALQQLARLEYAEGNLQKALEQLRKAKKIDPKLLTPEASLAMLLDRDGKNEDAEKWFEKAKNEAPEDLQTRLVIAQWKLRHGRYEEAAQEAEKALQIDPESSQAQLLRGAAALFLKDYTTAEKHFRNMLLQSPSNFAAANNLALALCEQPDRQKKLKALEYARVNVERHPERAESYSTLGWVLFQLGKNDAAMRALQRAAQSGQISSNTAYYIAAVLYARGNPDDAQLYLERALDSARPFSMRPEAKQLLQEIENQESS